MERWDALCILDTPQQRGKTREGALITRPVSKMLSDQSGDRGTQQGLPLRAP